jgi:hypothetical protein
VPPSVLYPVCATADKVGCCLAPPRKFFGSLHLEVASLPPAPISWGLLPTRPSFDALDRPFVHPSSKVVRHIGVERYRWLPVQASLSCPICRLFGSLLPGVGLAVLLCLKLPGAGEISLWGCPFLVWPPYYLLLSNSSAGQRDSESLELEVKVPPKEQEHIYKICRGYLLKLSSLSLITQLQEKGRQVVVEPKIFGLDLSVLSRYEKSSEARRGKRINHGGCSPLLSHQV